MMPRKVLLMLLCCACLQAPAQEFAWKASLRNPPADGFYRITLTPEFAAHVKADLSDLRIIDEREQQVPFLVHAGEQMRGREFRAVAILSRATDSSGTRIVLDLDTTSGTDHLSLVLANTAVTRGVSLSGSDDLRNWFIVHDNLALSAPGAHHGGQFTQAVYFPFVRYRYFMLRINNGRSDPLNITGAGIYPAPRATVEPEAQPHASAWEQRDSSDGRTYIFGRNPLPYPVDRLDLQITGPAFYHRQVQVHAASATYAPLKLLASFELESGKKTSSWLMHDKAENFLVIIENGDNPPLRVSRVYTSARPVSIVAWLEAGKNYFLAAGNEAAVFPSYDLARFRDAVPDAVPEIGYGQLLPNQVQAAGVASRKSWLWVSIIAFLLLLGVLSFRLVREVGRHR